VLGASESLNLFWFGCVEVLAVAVARVGILFANKWMDKVLKRSSALA